jgi:hypothetical protein
MDILTPELLDLARERGSAFVAIATDDELVEYGWDSTDARWEDILGALSMSENPLYVGVITEGVTVDNETYEMREHLTMTVVHQAGHESWKIPAGINVGEEPVVSLGELPPEELEFDLAALKAVLPW